jgi:hypothetical protein
VSVNPSRPLPTPCWKTSTRIPYAAATDRQLSTIALTAITTERNATSIRANANTSTKATTSGSAALIWSAESFHWAVSPVTPASVFGSAPTVSGMIVFRSSFSDAFDALSDPFPLIGIVMFATVPARLTASVIGSCARPLASARRSRREIASRTAGAFTFGALTITFAGSAVPGKACCIRL